jgi:hypothetical protein
MPFLFLSWRSHDRTVSAGNLEVPEAAKKTPKPNQIDRMTPEQRRRYDEIQRRKKELAEKERLILSRVTAQGRKDLTRADVVVGAMLRLQAQTSADKKQYRDNLIKGVEERDRYLFPEIWPKAVRVVRKRQKTEEAVAPAAGKS